MKINQNEIEKITQNNTNFQKQKVDFILQILTELELTKYLKNFQDNNITTETDFINLTEEKLSAIGITLFGPKKKILNAVLQYSKAESFKCKKKLFSASIVIFFLNFKITLLIYKIIE